MAETPYYAKFITDSVDEWSVMSDRVCENRSFPATVPTNGRIQYTEVVG